MLHGVFTVKYITSKNCFCGLSLNNLKHLQNNYVTLTYNELETSYITVDPALRVEDDEVIGINSLFAKVLGLEEDSLVMVSELAKLPEVQSCTIVAIDDTDHYVLESLANHVQSTLLKQIRVVTNGQKFVIWIERNIFVTVTICDIKPFSPGSLQNLTEVTIKPPDKPPTKAQTKEKKLKSILKKPKTVVKPVESPKPEPKALSTYPIEDQEQLFTPKTSEFVMRVVPLGAVSGTIEGSFNVFVFKGSKLGRAPPDERSIYTIKVLNQEKVLYVRVLYIEDFPARFSLKTAFTDGVFVSKEVVQDLKCELGTRVVLELYKGIVPLITQIEVYTRKRYDFDQKRAFQQYLADICQQKEAVLNADVVLRVTKKMKCLLKFHPVPTSFCVVNQDFVRSCKWILIDQLLPCRDLDEKDLRDDFKTDISNYGQIIDNCLFLVEHDNRKFGVLPNVLISGKTGAGKTALLESIARKLSANPYYIATETIECKSIKGKTVESLQKLFHTTFFKMIHCQPSILLIDDLEILCEVVNETEVQSTIYFNKITEMLSALFKNFTENNAVGIIATTPSLGKLHKNIYDARGNYFFKHAFTIEPLSKADRQTYLEYLLSEHEVDGVNFGELAQRTESFGVRNLFDLVEKSLFEGYQRNCEKMVVSGEDVQKALDSVVTTSLSEFRLHDPGEKNLDDIGGLVEAKKVLLETMLWPAKYPKLFNNTPLRLASGLLLYGPPGTGKTLLAGAAAKHCGLRLISIKGPELLSKYIGASEQAVRDVFHRAQSARPCLLFFDEFDSLAPRRGHDNTGVTDRVVNQFLTQLDGIETLSGVFVLAATSRPDLLDPALLRPGRLDIHIRCSLPDLASRQEILRSLSKTLTFHADVKLDELAMETEGYSGADLQAVLYTAQLDTVNQLLTNDDEEDLEVNVEIVQEKLVEALRSTKPSLNKKERDRYEKIYRNFEGGVAEFAPGSKATHA